MFSIFFAAIVLGANFVNASSIAYVKEDSSQISESIVLILEELGVGYEVIDDSEIPSADFSEFDILLVVENLGNANLLPLDRKTSIFLDRNIADNVWSIALTGVSTAREIKAHDDDSFVFDGIELPINDYVPVYLGQGSSIHYINILMESNVQVIATKLNTNRPIVAYKINGNNKEVFFGLRNPDEWNNNAKTMFKNIISWITEDLDNDGDGFVSDMDCNDNDPMINPEALEIPYDGIDQNCNGLDLEDNDEDGYTSDLVGGLDCDDYNPEINPDSSDPALNCVNDSPSILAIVRESDFFEGDLIEIEVIAEDPEDDIMEYSIDDERFEIEGNILTWQTEFEDSGEYEFEIIVSDGVFSDSENIFFEIQEQILGPFFREIPNQEWGEDSVLEINLNNYFVSNSGNAIVFGIDGSSENANLSVSLNGEIASFTPSEDWFGEERIRFFALDGETKIVSNDVILNVTAVNDAPEIIGEISNMILNEDQVLENAIDLHEYFTDIDSELEFSVEGNENVEIEIIEGVVSFTPNEDYSGVEEIRFIAGDGEFEIESNLITLTITEQGEHPVFNPLNCETNLVEDVSESCILNANDFENDEIEFFISGENNLKCTLLGNELSYVSEENYFGQASCILEVRDIHGSDFVTLEVTVLEVNDAPEIIASNPSNSDIIIIEGNSKIFAIQIADPEGNISTRWFLDGNSVFLSTGMNPVFNLMALDIGSHVLEAIVTDGELSSNKIWNVVVGPISDFTCAEAGGFIFEEKEICSGNILGVSDSMRCCSLAPEPKFDDANSCKILDQDIQIEIKKPESDEEFELGEKISVEMEFTNNFDEDQTFDVELHLYNLDRDKSVVENTADIEVKSDRTRVLKLDLEIPEDLELDDRYAILVIAEDEICNQEYQDLRIDRKEDQVIISNFDFPNEAVCGEEIETEIEVNNAGTRGQSIKLSLKNSELDLDKSILFELERYGDEDSENVDFSFLIPNDINSDNYFIEAVLEYGGKKESVKKEIYIECIQESVSEVGQIAEELADEPIMLNQNVISLENENGKSFSSNWLLVGMIAMMELLLITGIGLFVARKL